MKEFVFIIIFLSELLLGIGLVLSLLKTGMRIWPPPGKNSWQQLCTLALTFIAMAGGIGLGILDFNSLVSTPWLRFTIGGVLSVAGFLFALSGTRSLRMHMSLGLDGDLTTTGAYRYSRNPQYIGWAAFFVGYAVLCSSLLTLVVAGIGASLFVLAPFTEEPWLRERYGADYGEYVAQVPRFIGLRKRPPPTQPR